MRPSDGIRLTTKTLGLLRSAWWSTDRIAEYQEARLLGMLRYAVEHVPFYRALGFRADSLRSVADLERFPVIAKSQLQDNPSDFLSLEYDRSTLYRSYSSGTTGEPLETYFDPECWLLTKYATKARRVLSDSRSPKQRILVLSEHGSRTGALSGLARLMRVFVEIRYLDLADDVLDNLRVITNFKPTIVYGFPSYLVHLGDSAESAGVVLPRVNLIYTSSEVLTEQGRRDLERLYRGRVIDIYGSTEFKEIAVQCRHNRYHVNFESVYVESISENEDSLPRLIATTLTNRAMPLIRYELGDAGRLIDEECACGRRGPQIAAPQGRLADMLSFPNGTKLSPYLLTSAVELCPNIKHFHIVHEQPWQLRIETLAQPKLSQEQLDDLSARLRAHLPRQVGLSFLALSDRGDHRKRRAVSREF